MDYKALVQTFLLNIKWTYLMQLQGQIRFLVQFPQCSTCYIFTNALNMPSWYTPLMIMIPHILTALHNKNTQNIIMPGKNKTTYYSLSHVS